MFEFFVDITGAKLAIGRKVLSDGYSNPTFSISTFSILLVLEDSGKILAFIPWVEATLTNFGIDAYSIPPKTNLVSFIDPLAVFDVVEYFNWLELFVSYVKISGFSFNLISKKVSPTPITL